MQRPFELHGPELAITISDEGDGFDPTAVSDPLNPQNLMKTSGRGIFYMRTFMDQIRYSFQPGGGTSLVMTKNLAKGPASPAAKHESHRAVTAYQQRRTNESHLSRRQRSRDHQARGKITIGAGDQQLREVITNA